MKKILRWLKALLRVSNTRYISLQNFDKIEELNQKVEILNKDIEDINEKLKNLIIKIEELEEKVDKTYEQNYKSLKVYARKLFKNILDENR